MQAHDSTSCRRARCSRLISGRTSAPRLQHARQTKPAQDRQPQIVRPPVTKLLPMLGACFVARYCPGCCAIHRFTFPRVSIRCARSRKSDSDDFGAIHRKRLVMGRELGLDMPAACAHPQPRNDRISNVLLSSMNLDVRTWPIATFRCAAGFGRYRRHSGHRPSRTIKLDSLVRALVTFARGMGRIATDCDALNVDR